MLQEKQFGCTRCGHCCVQPGWVFFSLREMEAMAQHLGLKLAPFKRKYKITWDLEQRAWALDATDGQGCPLLTPERGCAVHPVKPIQCSSFPFWRELLEDPQAWAEVKKYCPGMDKGRSYSPAEIAAIQRGDRVT